MPSLSRLPGPPSARVLAHASAFALTLALSAALAGCSGPRVVPGAGIAVLPEHYAHSLAALGWPGARRAFQIGHGSVVSTGECALEWLLLPAGDSASVSPVWFERDGVPVAHWTMENARQRVTFEAAAAPERALGDTSLLLSVRATAEWLSAEPGEAGVEVRVRARPAGPGFVPWDAPRDTAFTEAWRDRSALRNGRIVAVLDRTAALPPDPPDAQRPAHSHGSGPGALVALCSAHLARGERHAWDFLVPAYPVAPGERALGRASHERIASASRRFWRDWLTRAATLETPDSLIGSAWRAALVTLVTCQERDAGHWAPIGSPFQYRDVWLRDGARVVRALAVAGLTDLARDDARTLAHFQLPTGVFLSQRGQLDGTGQALWAFEQVAALPPSPAIAREFLVAARDGLRWIRRQRGNTISLRLPWLGLLPYGDPRDGELVRAPLVGNDAWAIAGCRAVAEIARGAGDDSLAREALATAADYRGSFVAALAATRHPDIPPSWPGPGRDWGNASVGYPTLVLSADDPRLAALARRMRAHGEPTGLVCYGAEDSLHTYLGADLAQWSLLAGRPAEARAWLAGVLAHSSSTLGQAEIFQRAGDFGSNLPPHATAAATLVDLMRNSIACDTRDTLEVALGAPLAWWGGTRLERAPTRFGVTSVRLERPAAEVLRVRLEPLPVPVRVRVPDGARAIAGLSAGARVTGGAWVDAPAGTREVSFRIAEEPQR
jgi:hypothetical protein